ncbi:F0F1 ATP synthase subunit delta [Protaetiibacter intestinalis]|uniref:ATP synthase subunit delta n=1 Tax=Protaetiibacter intestinalis TaxID=2419774 RepID=A0A387BA71_9MICO|nr:F0F1 ATP synthase subunit delta [Protaetiibacter intestinalis]AYF98791.1 F0F1 ATP synthase subunit delta [Protaetiibacter intestinalis]
MGSATRSALATAKAALDAEKGTTLATGEELLAAARALAGSPQLRAVLADPAIPGAEKSKLISAAFARVGAGAGRLLAVVAESRWSSSDELVAGVEELGIRAIAGADAADSIEQELFSVGRVIGSDAELELALGSKLGDPAAKGRLVEKLLAGKASPATTAILAHLVQSPRGRRIGELISLAARIVSDTAGRLVATVTTAVALSDAQVKRLGAALAAQYGREVLIDVVLDPAVLGGIRVQVGDEVVDGTVSSRLSDLRLQLAG